MSLVRSSLVLVIALVIAPAVARAQTAVSSADITRLETTVTEVERHLVNLKTTDATLAAQIERQLADVREEVTYLKVKFRREGSVPRDEYTNVRDRLDTLLIKARRDKVTAQPALEPEVGKLFKVAVGTPLDVRLQTPLNSGTAKVEQRFEATTVLDLELDREVVIPAGSVVRGFVSSVKAAGRLDRTGSMTLSFDELRVENRSYKLRASVMEALDGKVSEDVTRIGVGSVVGGIVGAIIGGGKGALLGVVIGGGGAIVATEGSNVDLPVGTILRIRLDQPVDIVK
jgi:hypothetical protein